jgi:hypothetical protein
MAGVRTVPLSGQLVAMLKGWKLKSQFSKADDLIFPNRNGRHIGHDNLVKRQFQPLFDEVKTVKRFNWHGLRHFAVSCWVEAKLAPKTVQTFAGHARWTDMAICSRAMITGRRWTRLPRDCSNDPRGTLGEQASLFMCHSCDMDAPIQDGTREESLDFVEIPQHGT